MRALVTGASGFLGRHLIRALRERGDFVVALVRDFVLPTAAVDRFAPSAVVFGGFDEVRRAIAEYELDTVFHLAAQTQVSTAVADPVGTFEANVQGTWKVLEVCRQQKVSRVLVASSDKAYGNGPFPYQEMQSLWPDGIYATSKAAGDFIAQAYAREFLLPVSIVRCGNLYGPGHTNWSTLIPGTIRSVLRGERPRLRSAGTSQRDFLFVEDAVEGYVALADTRTAAGDIYNLGTGHGWSALTVVQEILNVMGSRLAPIIAADSTSVEIPAQVVNAEKAYHALGWRPRHTLAEGLAKTIDWYRLHLEAL